MNPKLFGRILGIVVLTLALNAAGAAAGMPVERANAIWQTSWIDSANSLGEYNSTAIDPASGTVYISYYDETNQQLKAAASVGKGSGNCGSGASFLCQTVDSQAGRGRPSAIAIDPTRGYPAIAYYDAAGRDLYYAAYACASGAACAWGTPELVDARDTFDGDFLSLKFTSAGRPTIAYHASSPGGAEVGSLKVAAFVNTGGNCGASAGRWQCSYIRIDAALADFGRYPSLAVDGQNAASIAYSDGGGSLWLARFVGGSSGNCGPAGADWDCELIDGGSLGQPRRFSSIALGTDDSPRIAYAARASDGSTDDLMYAIPVASGGNCGPAGNWDCRQVDTLNAIPAPSLQPLALAMDGANFAQIAYSKGGDLYYGAEMGGLGAGNCGAPVDNWQCSPVQTSPINILAGCVSIGLDPGGLPTIVYSNYTPSGKATGYDLFYATLRLPTYIPMLRK